MAETKTEAQKLAEKLLVKKKNGWEGLNDQEKRKIMQNSEKINENLRTSC